MAQRELDEERQRHQGPPEPDLARLGTFIRTRRQALGMTQTQLADAVRWTQERISALENGRYGLPSLPALVQLAQGLQASLPAVIAAAGFADLVPGMETQTSTAETDAAFLYTLEQLLAIEETGLHEVLSWASDVLARGMAAEKIDVFLVDPALESLVALGTSDTSLGRRQHQLGMDRLPLTDGGRTVQAYHEGRTVITGNAQDGTVEPPGITEGLGIRSMVLVPLRVDGEVRGVLSAVSQQEEKFSRDEVQFFEAVARWVALLIHREELLGLQEAPEPHL